MASMPFTCPQVSLAGSLGPTVPPGGSHPRRLWPRWEVLIGVSAPQQRGGSCTVKHRVRRAGPEGSGAGEARLRRSPSSTDLGPIAWRGQALCTLSPVVGGFGPGVL